MGSRSIRKGKAWEREVALLISQATSRDVKRNLTEPREGNVGDLDTADLPLTVQCKVGKRPDCYRALREAISATKKGDYSVAIVRKNGVNMHVESQDLAVLPLDDFLELLRVLTGSGVW